MSNEIVLKELQGDYDISYQSTPILDNWYEVGIGAAKIEGTRLRGLDGAGISWDANLKIVENNLLEFQATLDPTNAPPNAALMGSDGILTRSKQNYEGVLKLTNSNGKIILRTTIKRGPLTIEVQLLKRS